MADDLQPLVMRQHEGLAQTVGGDRLDGVLEQQRAARVDADGRLTRRRFEV
jgi:hypothetical protein